jgi:hypothetical protein
MFCSDVVCSGSAAMQSIVSIQGDVSVFDSAELSPSAEH